MAGKQARYNACMFRMTTVGLLLAGIAVPAFAQTPPAAPSRTASVNTAPRVDVTAMPRPIDMHDSVWIEDLTMLEVRDLLKAGKTTALVLTGGIEENGPYLTTGKHNNVLRAQGESIAGSLGNALVAPIVTLEGFHDDYYITSIIATVDTDAIRMHERREAERFAINGVRLDPIEKTISNGLRIVQFRTNVAVAAIKRSMSSKATAGAGK
jgi:creatinine amidohydrolase/Fe(II)-dependent formamide hydrolase-like protein